MEPKSSFFVQAPEGWSRLLTASASLLDRYVEANCGDEYDVPYWYGERALTGILAAAAWSLPKCWSLEEFLGHRGDADNKRAGRGDLWIGGEVGDYTVEAKQSPAYDQAATAIEWVRDRLRDAGGQLRALAPVYRWGKPVALCYLVPDLRCTLSSGQCTDFFATIKDGFAGSAPILATYQVLARLPEDGGRIYPGVMVIGEVLGGWE